MPTLSRVEARKGTAAAATVTDNENNRALIGVFQGVNELSMIVVRWLMHLAPVAVFVLAPHPVSSQEKPGVRLVISVAAFTL